ncbi:MAG: hypothetical protein ACTSWW_12480, partial [Promethearchaeota archaeon]
KGLASDMVFLAADIMSLRVPPVALIKDPEDRHLPSSLKTSYLTEVRTFFEHYVPEERDTMEIIDKVLLDPACYEVLKLMREAFVTRNDLEKLRKKGVDDVDRVLKVLWETKMVGVLQDEHNNEYYCLTSDFHIQKFFPRYNLDTIRSQYRTRAQNPNVLVKALDLMKEDYYLSLQSEKAARTEAVPAE